MIFSSTAGFSFLTSLISLNHCHKKKLFQFAKTNVLSLFNAILIYLSSLSTTLSQHFNIFEFYLRNINLNMKAVLIFLVIPALCLA